MIIKKFGVPTLMQIKYTTLQQNKDTKIKAAGANGKDGLPGKDGSVIYAEAGKPTADKGKQGDYYIDTETKMF